MSGNWKDHMECHIEPDWLLIYRIDRKYNELILVRTGSHSELFGK
ncbi:MAG: type II toxin-antitoxin system YafQ family toxin [Acidobacteria bacterium]|nr:type II toxin-antitoxin system YafQ family toxin [Acidobacteriota bacterium]